MVGRLNQHDRTRADIHEAKRELSSWMHMADHIFLRAPWAFDVGPTLFRFPDPWRFVGPQTLGILEPLRIRERFQTITLRHDSERVHVLHEMAKFRSPEDHPIAVLPQPPESTPRGVAGRGLGEGSGRGGVKTLHVRSPEDHPIAVLSQPPEPTPRGVAGRWLGEGSGRGGVKTLHVRSPEDRPIAVLPQPPESTPRGGALKPQRQSGEALWRGSKKPLLAENRILRLREGRSRGRSRIRVRFRPRSKPKSSSTPAWRNGPRVRPSGSGKFGFEEPKSTQKSTSTTKIRLRPPKIDFDPFLRDPRGPSGSFKRTPGSF